MGSKKVLGLLDLGKFLLDTKLSQFVIFMLIKASWRSLIVQESARGKFKQGQIHRILEFNDCSHFNEKEYQLHLDISFNLLQQT